MPFGAVLSPRRRRLSSALASGQSFMNPHPRAVQRGAGPSALSAKVENSDGACVLVSEQFHVEHLRVRVCCVFDLRKVTGGSCSNPVGRWPLIRFPGCHYRHFQNLIPKRTDRLGFTLRAHT